MPTDGPTFEVIGDLTDEAIEALAALLLSVQHEEISDVSPPVAQPSEATP